MPDRARRGLIGALAALAGLVGAVPAALAQQACDPPQDAAGHAEQVRALTNAFRRDRGRGALTASAQLQEAAQRHACHMARTGDMSHTGKGGSDVGDRAAAAGYRWGFIAENVAVGQPDPATVIAGWKGSDGHRRNMLDRGARDIGIGVARGGGRLYWAMVLGAPLD